MGHLQARPACSTLLWPSRGPYLFGVRPRVRRDWRVLTVTIGFLSWLLAGFASLR
jgi:hypothetical protein